VKYMALIYADEAGWDVLTEDERKEAYARYGALSREAEAAGVLAGGSELASTRDATTVRVRNEELLVTDGPYVEVKEALGGFYLFECDSLDEALDWAARIPAVEYGAVEVRPVYFDPEEEHL